MAKKKGEDIEAKKKSPKKKVTFKGGPKDGDTLDMTEQSAGKEYSFHDKGRMHHYKLKAGSYVYVEPAVFKPKKKKKPTPKPE